MGYGLYLTRSGDWTEEETPITIEDVERILDKLPGGFHIDRSGKVSAVLPDGQRLTAEIGEFVEYYDGVHEESRVRIFFNGDCPEFSVAEERQMLPIFDLAEALGAQIQGDEFEIYTREEIDSSGKRDAAGKPAKASWLKKLFGKKGD